MVSALGINLSPMTNCLFVIDSVPFGMQSSYILAEHLRNDSYMKTKQDKKDKTENSSFFHWPYIK